MFISTWKRRILVSGFQYRLLAGNFLYLLSIVVAFFIVLFGPVAAVLGDEKLPELERELAAQQLLALHERVWFALPALIALCLLHSAVVTHRIAGPLYRFRQIFADVARGDLSLKVQLRRGDYLREEAVLMAAMLRTLSERVQAIQEGYRRASATLPSLMDAVARAEQHEAAVLAGQLGTQMDELGRRVRQFQDSEGQVIQGQQPKRIPVAVPELPELPRIRTSPS